MSVYTRFNPRCSVEVTHDVRTVDSSLVLLVVHRLVHHRDRLGCIVGDAMTSKPLLNGWMWVVLTVAVLFAVTFIWAYQNPYVVRFEMDDNTLEAVKSIDWEALESKESSSYDCDIPLYSSSGAKQRFANCPGDLGNVYVWENNSKAHIAGYDGIQRNLTLEYCWKAHMYPNGTMECAVYD